MQKNIFSMKALQSSYFRSICAIIVGILLIQYRQEMMHWLMIAIGIIFLISGLISVVSYYSAIKHQDEDIQVFDSNGKLIINRKPTFPIVGIGSLVLGGILTVMPSTFIIGLMYILASILILGAINMFANLASANKFAQIGLFWWIIPSIILLIGIFIMVNPLESAETPLVIIGWSMLLYGVIECINAIKIHQIKRTFANQHATPTTTSSAEDTHTNSNREQKINEELSEKDFE